MDDVHFSRQTDEWETPKKFFDEVSAEFGPFDLDVCATADNTKCDRFFDKRMNGLDENWATRNWCNPPYSNIKKWVLKARREQLKGNTTVMLIPARTDTSWFHESMYRVANVEIRFLRGRLEFIGPVKSNNPRAPFPSMLVIFQPI